MSIDPSNPVVQLCAGGMAIEGNAHEARALFERAWEIRRDDYEASIAAHFVARHQSTADETLAWNLRALEHAEAVGDARIENLLASLYLNVGDSYRFTGRYAEASVMADRARDALVHLPADGYRDLISMGIERLQQRLAEASVGPTTAEHHEERS